MYCFALPLWTSDPGVDWVDAEVAGHAVHCAKAIVGWTADIRSGFITWVIEDGEELHRAVHGREGDVQKCPE